MRTFRLIVSSATEVLFNGNATYCRVETVDGAMGFEARHEASIVLLNENSTIDYVDESGTRESLHAPNGILDFSHNRCVVLVGQDETAESG